MYAIVATGGKQLKVAAGDVVTVEKLDAAVGESVTFDVIFLADGEDITVDPAALASMKVTGEVVEQFKGEKAIIFKFKKRKGYKRLKGHRQNLTKVRITGVSAVAEKPAAKKPAVAEKPAAKKPAVAEKPAEKKPAAKKAPAKKPAVAEKPAVADKPAAKKPVAKKAPAKKAAEKVEAPVETVDVEAPAAEQE